MLYRIITYILFILGGFLAVMLLTMLMAALANPVLLLPVFLVACVVIYSYASWRFLTRGIIAHMYCRPSLRDLIRVNGYGTLAFGVMTAVQCFTLIMNPSLFEDVMEQALSMQKATAEGMETMMRNFMGFMLKFMLVYSITLIIHVLSTFRLLRRHMDAFQQPAE